MLCHLNPGATNAACIVLFVSVIYCNDPERVNLLADWSPLLSVVWSTWFSPPLLRWRQTWLRWQPCWRRRKNSLLVRFEKSSHACMLLRAPAQGKLETCRQWRCTQSSWFAGWSQRSPARNGRSPPRDLAHLPLQQHLTALPISTTGGSPARCGKAASL